MNTKYSDITIVLDRSGSMQSVQSDTIGGFNTLLQQQRELKGDKTLLTLIQFSTGSEIVFNAVDIQAVAQLTKVNYQPSGCTALLDAVGDAITAAGNRFVDMAPDSRPGKVLFVIITDGQENASNRYNRSRIKEMITTQQNSYQWQFVFLGANQDSFTAADNLGILRMNTSNYYATAVGTASAFAAVSANVISYRSDTPEQVRSKSFYQVPVEGVDNSNAAVASK